MKKFEKEIQRIYQQVFYFIVARVKDREQAEDITQSVMEMVLLNLDNLRKPEAFRAWVLQIARNKVNEYYRGIKRYHTLFQETDFSQVDTGDRNYSYLTEVEEDLLQQLITEEDKLNIMLALECIEQKYQDVIRLNIICEYSLIETAQILGENVNTVRTWSARGLVKLKEEFARIELGEMKNGETR